MELKTVSFELGVDESWYHF